MRERARDIFRRGGFRGSAGRNLVACGKAAFDIAIARGSAAAVRIKVLRSETGISMASDDLAPPAIRRGAMRSMSYAHVPKSAHAIDLSVAARPFYGAFKTRMGLPSKNASAFSMLRG